jgi:hypothetical protein
MDSAALQVALPHQLVEKRLEEVPPVDHLDDLALGQPHLVYEDVGKAAVGGQVAEPYYLSCPRRVSQRVPKPPALFFYLSLRALHAVAEFCFVDRLFGEFYKRLHLSRGEFVA